MSEANGDAVEPAGLPRELLQELHAFLSLEAPFLIRDLPRVSSEEALEEALLARIEARSRTGDEFAEDLLYPRWTHRQAVERNRAELELAVSGFFARRRIKRSLQRHEQRLMLRTMLLTREVDRQLKEAFDRKEILWGEYPSPQKGFRSTGQEAIVGAALRLRRYPEFGQGETYRGDFIAPMIRDLGALLMFMPDPLHPLLVQYGKAGTPMEGRDLHTGDFARGVLPPVAPLALATQTLVGLAYAFKLNREERVCVAFIGDGGASLGEWHESVNFAAVQRLNMVFVIENNQWALGTHVSEQTATARFARRAAGYGIPGVTLFGNDPEEVAAGVTWAADRARAGEGPSLVELVTYRRSGHAHHDDDRFHGNAAAKVPGYELVDEAEAWSRLDPIDLYEVRLQKAGVLDSTECAGLREAVALEVKRAAEAAAAAPWPEAESYRQRVYAPRSIPPPQPVVEPVVRQMAYDEAVRAGMEAVMTESEDVFVLGEDVGGRYGGAFGVTRGLGKRFGGERCLNTPLAESAIVGCAVGAALLGKRPIVEMQFADFLAPAFNELVNNAAKLYWRWGRRVPMVVRLPYGGATGTMNMLLGGGPFHSQCPEMWFLRIPGWKIVAPSNPVDAKGLMIAAVHDDNPVLYLEAKGLYGFFRTDLRQAVPEGHETETPIGAAAITRPGDDLTVLTYGAMVWTAMAAAEQLEEEGVSTEVIDLRTLWPLDETTICRSVEKTHRVLILHEDNRRGGLGGELAALISKRSFYFLDAPIQRVAAPDTPAPYSPPLEHDYLPKVEQVLTAAIELLEQ
jgi:2-oxoisovalerate dehydrogenase E1 component